MKHHVYNKVYVLLAVLQVTAFSGCIQETERETIPVITWAGVPADRSAEVFPLLRECGITCHLGLYGDSAEALAALKAAEETGIGLIPGFPGIRDSTSEAVAMMKDSPALVAWHIKDEPELWDIPWIAELVAKVQSLDSLHPPYVNLYPGSAAAHRMGGVELAAFGAGSGFLGIPGDVTPPSRFVRAAFYQTTAPQQETSHQSVIQSFHILNNFDIPIGIEFATGQMPADMPSATQWTSATDLSNLEIYYRTMYNSSIRCIDLRTIDFSKVKYRAEPLDAELEQPVVPVVIR